MKIAVAGKLFDPNFYAMILILTDKDKENIANMDPEATMYYAYPDGFSAKDIQRFLDDWRERLA